MHTWGQRGWRQAANYTLSIFLFLSSASSQGESYGSPVFVININYNALDSNVT